MGTGASNGGRRSHCRKKSRSLHAREDSCSGAAANLICHGDATDTFHSQTPNQPLAAKRRQHSQLRAQGATCICSMVPGRPHPA